MKKGYVLHRWITEAPDDLQVDHINRDTLDNRDCNLRIVTAKENTQNKGLYRNSKTKIKGITYYKPYDNWCARVYIDGKRHWVGRYPTIEEAQIAIEKYKKNYEYNIL